ncbi:binding-protein-dependent transport systems inner membrane component [Alkaliphilus metalliredigens QYMF]|uniref:Binding-protein-dependent transport systems inner membrane component n=1 Tax=Alkaliphilus metalliredigens (strain QYMF) TaxID=293826 RepID=A6TX71_ALKMQ|nr:nickel/cobalt ABC transporter permease [Alkaliphilus metalliredigens]ABR50789.1 binding-protein-dependent transport systems inner membrane component [Alkaliphilus metalliredigens QYMF]
MRNYIIRRILFIIPILIGITFISFLLINLNTSDPAEVALRVNEITPTDEAVAAMREELGLDKPFFERYIIWLGNSLRFDFGNSYINNKSVSDEMLSALPATLYLAAIALIMILGISIVAGILCAIFEDSIGDKIIRGIIFVGTAMPNFWVGLLLMWLFAVKLDLFPTSGMSGFSSVILPAATLSLSYISIYTRLIRNNMIQNKNENYVLYTRIRGLKNWAVTKHIFRNSIQSSITALGMSIPKLIAGTVIVENIFAWPGIGRLCVSAIFNRDYPIIQAYIVMMALLFVVCNLIVDIISASLDPRIRRTT